jgi:hypothetical protein
MIKGGCHCGDVQYRIDQPQLDDVANCHCSDCRRTTGGTYVTWATVPISVFHWTGEEPNVYKPDITSKRYFCPNCGAQLAMITELAPDTIDITVSTLQDPDKYPPTRDVWVKSKITWVELSGSTKHESEETL